MFHNKVVVITGGAQGIGKCIAEEFKKNNAFVCIIDKQPNDYFVGDLAEKEVLHRFVETVIADYGKVDYLINNALPLMKGIEECSYEEFNYALKVGITAPFYLTKLFLPYFAPDAAIVNISSSRDRMSQPQTESYTAEYCPEEKIKAVTGIYNEIGIDKICDEKINEYYAKGLALLDGVSLPAERKEELKSFVCRLMNRKV